MRQPFVRQRPALSDAGECGSYMLSASPEDKISRLAHEITAELIKQ